MNKKHTLNGKDFPMREINYAQPENWGKLFDIIDHADALSDNDRKTSPSGVENQTPDLLVIDQYGPFADDPNANRNKLDFDHLMLELIRRYPGIAILVLHQENKQGGERGNETTFNSSSAKIKIHRLSDKECEKENLPRGQREVFELHFTKKGRCHEEIRSFWPKYIADKNGINYKVFKAMTNQGLVTIETEEDSIKAMQDNARYAYERLESNQLNKKEIAEILNRDPRTLDKDMGK